MKATISIIAAFFGALLLVVLAANDALAEEAETEESVVTRSVTCVDANGNERTHTTTGDEPLPECDSGSVGLAELLIVGAVAGGAWWLYGTPGSGFTPHFRASEQGFVYGASARVGAWTLHYDVDLRPATPTGGLFAEYEFGSSQ